MVDNKAVAPSASASLLPAGNDPSPPYHLNASDSPGAVLVTCLLKGENYPTWRRAMINALKAKNKLGFVDGSIEKPEEAHVSYSTWSKCSSMVIYWIFNSLAPELHDSVAYSNTARNMWIDLEELFSQGNAPRIHELKRELALGQQRELSVAVYYTKLKALWDELATYSNMPNCSCGAAKELVAEREAEKLHQFLMGLNEHFNNVRSHILNMEPLPSLNKAYALVTKEEKHLDVVTQRNIVPEAAAFNVKRTSKNNVGKDTNEQCNHCGKSGHVTEKCFEIIGYPDWWPGKKKNPSSQGKRNPKTGQTSIHQVSVVDKEKSANDMQLTPVQIQQLIALLPKHKEDAKANYLEFGERRRSPWR